jgi:hypothetical protein
LDPAPVATNGAGKTDKADDLAQLEKRTARVVARQKLVEAQLAALAALHPA